MTSCILTIIKNEHLYLDEWIKYHLDLGIDHIFIFEDFDSASHKNITSKYKDVSLYSIVDILNEGELARNKEYKLTKFRSPQRLYVYKGLLFVKNNFSYDWCFVIDNDEFITLENNSLNDTLTLFKSYDAIVLSWYCFGANGLINKPDYSKNGVISTYTTKMAGYVPIVGPAYNKKTCYNLNTYNFTFWNDVHTPSDKCNFCNTNFRKDKNNTVYKIIYLRHYITKSWEEYLWKKKYRGYFCGFSRSFNAFFKINPDLLEKKDELLAQVDEETLVVLPYTQNGSQGNEIRIALSSWKKFCRSKYHFVVIGDFNQQLKHDFPWVEFIEVPRAIKKFNQYQPHIDIQNKMEIIYNKFKDTYSGFIWMVDDNYAIKPFYIFELKTLYYHTDNFEGAESTPTSFWRHDKWKTRQLLDKENLPHINYTTHFPCYFEFNKLKEIWDKYNMQNESYVIEDLYFNSFLHVKPILDKKIRLGIWNKKIFENDFEKAINKQNIKFVCNSVDGWSKELEQALWKIIENDN